MVKQNKGNKDGLLRGLVRHALGLPGGFSGWWGHTRWVRTTTYCWPKLKTCLRCCPCLDSQRWCSCTYRIPRRNRWIFRAIGETWRQIENCHSHKQPPSFAKYYNSRTTRINNIVRCSFYFYPYV